MKLSNLKVIECQLRRIVSGSSTGDSEPIPAENALCLLVIFRSERGTPRFLPSAASRLHGTMHYLRLPLAFMGYCFWFDLLARWRYQEHHIQYRQKFHGKTPSPTAQSDIPNSERLPLAQARKRRRISQSTRGSEEKNLADHEVGCEG